MSHFYEGDIELDPELEGYVKSGGVLRTAMRERHITSNVQQAINDFHSKTCVRFVNYYSGYHKNFIEFRNKDGCSSRVGKRYAAPGRQTISIGNGCNNVGTIIHELMHAIGFFHEQARIDRDKYVEINWENILDGFSDQFDKYSWKTIDDLGVSYDYQSIMHYDRMAFTKNGKPTIVAIKNENMRFRSPDFKLSTRDAVKINALYDCQTTSFGWTSWSAWTPCDDNCYRTRDRYCYHSGNVKSCGGKGNAYGVETQKEKCPAPICPAPVNGHWGRWSEWESCSKTCNDGVRRRVRTCTNPPPAHGGKTCPGSENDNEMCILKRCHLDNDDADFENSRLGMWRNSNSDNLNWDFNRLFTQTVDTGPSNDHTSGQGYYLYMESSGTRTGETVDLVSPWLASKSEGQCLKFYYTMYGKTMGSLSIKVELSNDKSWFIFYKNGNQGMKWRKGTGNIEVPLGLWYRLRIQGKIGQVGGYSDIAIDDVYIDPGLCNCQDDFYTCHIWAAKGECSANEVWMKRNCERSCHVCGGVTPSSCEDINKAQCPLWAKNGECEKNPIWMKVNCQKSCKFCSPTPSTCRDSNKSCPAWAKLGECTKNPAWMNLNCKLSCGQC
ncbi:hypothetical protein ACROYT_G030900 [Oculina patagonica]